MSEQEKQQAIDALERMDQEHLKHSLIYLLYMADASPSPKPIAPVHLELVSNAGR